MSAVLTGPAYIDAVA